MRWKTLAYTVSTESTSERWDNSGYDGIHGQCQQMGFGVRDI